MEPPANLRAILINFLKKSLVVGQLQRPTVAGGTGRCVAALRSGPATFLPSRPLGILHKSRKSRIQLPNLRKLLRNALNGVSSMNWWEDSSTCNLSHIEKQRR
jgi:hypothetical protein